jgi:hypothetical protein
MRNRRRTTLWCALFIAFFGVIALSSVYSNPRSETIHVLDVIRLMTAGASVALTIFFLVHFFGYGPLSEDKRAGEKSGEESN